MKPAKALPEHVVEPDKTSHTIIADLFDWNAIRERRDCRQTVQEWSRIDAKLRTSLTTRFNDMELHEALFRDLRVLTLYTRDPDLVRGVATMITNAHIKHHLTGDDKLIRDTVRNMEDRIGFVPPAGM